MIREKIRAAAGQARPADAPARVWRDWALVGGLIPTALLEGLLRPDLTWRWLSMALVIPLAAALLWRRTRPLAMTLLIFGAIGLISTYSLAVGVVWEGLTSMVVVLVVVYALGRWGSGREIIIGGAATLVVATIGFVSEQPEGVGDIIGGYLILLFTLEVGIIVRSQARSQAQAIERFRLMERAQLARELHDTVAHHVSAIAVQAQAGRTLADSRPEAALDALQVIEEEASRTLEEMRSMVGALRQEERPEYEPQPGVADIARLAESNGGGPRVDIELSGDLDGLRPAVDTALFRLTQESITNAVRHARNATRISVRLAGGADHVHLTVDDDGDSGGSGAPRLRSESDTGRGYGLVGMRERAKLLGGSLAAGPKPGRGWSVTAVLPRDGDGS